MPQNQYLENASDRPSRSTYKLSKFVRCGPRCPPLREFFAVALRLQVRRFKGRKRMCAEGATKILEAYRDIVKGNVNLSSWERKIRKETDVEFKYDDHTEVENPCKWVE